MNSYYLFVNPGFLSGMARVFDLGATWDDYNDWPTPEQADFYALRSDWKMVGKDIRKAIAQFEESRVANGER